MRAAARAGLFAGLAVLGVAVAVAGSFVQAMWTPGGGLLLALAATVALFYGGRLLAEGRAGGLVPAVAWIVPVLYLASGRAEGDFVFADGAASYAYLLVGALAGVLAATMPVTARR